MPIGDLSPARDESDTIPSLLQSSLPPRFPGQTQPTADIQTAPADELLAAVWQKVGGPSAIEQVKTVLAGIGVLSLLALFWRMGRRSEPEGDAD
jgi:hypothetical protein